MTLSAKPLQQALLIACPLLTFAVMFGHVTGIVNVCLALIGVGLAAVVCSRDRPSLGAWPLVVPIALWAAWTLAAVTWSPLPNISFHAWLDEVLYPLLTFFAFWIYATRVDATRVALPAWLACLGLALITALYWGKLQPPTPETFPLRFYARVGHTSTLALLAVPLFVGLSMRPGRKWLGVSGVLFCMFIGLGTLNRFFLPAIAITLGIALLPVLRRYPRRSIVAFAVICAVAFGIVIHEGLARFGAAPHVPGAPPREAASTAMATLDNAVAVDTRPLLWGFYTRAGMQHPWRGIGFGKPLPGIAYRSQMPASLIAREPLAPTHAHNLVIDTWLQTGLIGAVLQLALFAALVLRFWRGRSRDVWLASAGAALVIGMIVKNIPDDFMWKTTMLAFWAFAGLLLGALERRAAGADTVRDHHTRQAVS